jgi:hypothetical protein
MNVPKTREEANRWIDELLRRSTTERGPDLVLELVAAARGEAPANTVYLVGNGTYLADELHGVFARQEDAAATAAQLGGMWEASAWDVEPGKSG